MFSITRSMRDNKVARSTAMVAASMAMQDYGPGGQIEVTHDVYGRPVDMNSFRGVAEGSDPSIIMERDWRPCVGSVNYNATDTGAGGSAHWSCQSEPALATAPPRTYAASTMPQGPAASLVPHTLITRMVPVAKSFGPI